VWVAQAENQTIVSIYPNAVMMEKLTPPRLHTKKPLAALF